VIVTALRFSVRKIGSAGTRSVFHVAGRVAEEVIGTADGDDHNPLVNGLDRTRRISRVVMANFENVGALYRLFVLSRLFWYVHRLIFEARNEYRLIALCTV
jgi:hypothetical protein